MAIKLKASKRDNLQTSNTKEIRQRGDVPGVVYGKEKDPVTLSVNSIELLKTVRDNGKNAIISLDVEGGDTLNVMLHEHQIDPLKDELIHADFYAVNMKEDVDVEVSIHTEGEAEGVREGGVLQQPLYELAIRAKPGEIPEEIKVDVSELQIGDSIMVSDLKEGRNYEILEDENATIVSVTPPEEMPEEPEEATDEQPEALREDDDDENEDENK
ncbi:50S ribosomal protein L25/general stress protein Ctc [Salimicrobium flavidum]|uniref:Large ribosomal subunit protein bL25 n=1 Tax=Salimicrobium flavidum TaxID=570947 RepID=A0A1N7KKR8_9BACI|nr:50S ribosomal protein L25/general stress protein Ctc [Salimicrobium flavidum]SIS62173.1 LSU ribosomal protein L25P [Salimicrobium flavidum]